MDFSSLFHQLDHEALLQVVLAVVLGGTLGMERELRGRPAGLRTMILVCLGSTMIMIVSSRLPTLYQTELDAAIVRVDPGRIAAGIVTGVGFLGAGVIIKLGDLVRGVTTAATIWFVAALGIVLGQGFYALSIVATITALVVLWLFSVLERVLRSYVYRTVEVSVGAKTSDSLLQHADELFAELQMRVMEIGVAESVIDQQTELRFRLKTNRPELSHAAVKRLAAHEGVQHVRWY